MVEVYFRFSTTSPMLRANTGLTCSLFFSALIILVGGLGYASPKGLGSREPVVRIRLLGYAPESETSVTTIALFCT